MRYLMVGNFDHLKILEKKTLNCGLQKSTTLNQIMDSISEGSEIKDFIVNNA